VKKLEAIIQPYLLERVKAALLDAGVEGLTVSEVRGRGRARGRGALDRGHEYAPDLRPKLKLEMVLPDGLLEDVAGAIALAAPTGRIGGGKLFVYDVEEAIRIRNSQR
jgi:nitrogen regulatory protein P-II 1